MLAAEYLVPEKKHGGSRPGAGHPRKIETEFAKWAKEKGYNGPTLAKALNVSVPFAYHLLAERRRPDLETAHEIERLSEGKFPTEYWLKIQRSSNT